MNATKFGFVVKSDEEPGVLLQKRLQFVKFYVKKKRITYRQHHFPAYNSKQAKDALTAIYHLYLDSTDHQPFWSYFEKNKKTIVGGYILYEMPDGLDVYVRKDEGTGKTYVTDDPKNPDGEIEYSNVRTFIDAAWTLYNMSIPF